MEKIKVYKTGGYNELIEEILVNKVSDKTVWLNNRRVSKRSSFANYWDSKEEAKEYIIRNLNISIKNAENKIKKAHKDLQELKKY